MAFKGVATLDVGSSKITATIAERGVNNTFSVKGQVVRYYEGFAEGQFLDEQSLELAINDSVAEVVKQTGTAISEIYVSVPGVFIRLENKKYKLSLGKQRKITKSDVNSLFEEGKMRVKTEGYEVIGYSEIFFALDDNRKVENPVGVVSSMLGGAITYYLCENYFAQTIRKILSRNKIKDVRFVFVGQVEGNYLLSKEERETPSLLLDVGYITSEMTIHLGNGILAECSEDFGGGILTYHMVKEFDLEVLEGETLKREINFALNPSAKSSYLIEIDERALDFPSERVNEIAFSVVDSFLGSVAEFLEQNTPPSMENLKVYLTGGGLSYLRGIKSHVSARLGSPVEILNPKIPFNAKPEFSSVYALLDYALTDKESKKKSFFHF